MTEEERRALGNARRLVFQNVANGQPVERVVADMRLSEGEIDAALRFAGKKITEYLVLRRQPPIDSGEMAITLADRVKIIRYNRRQLLPALARIGDLDLSTQLTLGKILVQEMDSEEMIRGAQHRMAEAKH